MVGSAERSPRSHRAGHDCNCMWTQQSCLEAAVSEATGTNETYNQSPSQFPKVHISHPTSHCNHTIELGNPGPRKTPQTSPPKK
eukprot:3086380-Amphidinium_carterae.1